MYCCLFYTKTDSAEHSSSVQFSSVQDGIYALWKAHMRSTPSLRSFPKVALKQFQCWNVERSSGQVQNADKLLVHIPLYTHRATGNYYSTRANWSVFVPAADQPSQCQCQRQLSPCVDADTETRARRETPGGTIPDKTWAPTQGLTN